MIISNFLYRVGQYARENRAKLIEWALIAAGIIALFLVGRYGIERIQKWSYEKGVQAKEKELREIEAKSQKLEQESESLKRQLNAKQAEAQFFEELAKNADARLLNAKQKVVTLKETYETIRYTPVPDTPVSCADACKQLAAIGYPCK